MITTGVDVGAKVIKVVILNDDHILSKVAVPAGNDKQRAAGVAVEQAAKKAGILKEDIERITSTGSRQQRIDFADDKITVIGADARGAARLFPSSGMVIDVGAEEWRVIKYNPNGKAVDFVTNEKCAAGAGTFIEAVARALDVKLEDMGALSLTSQKAIPVNAQCAVFAESEVVSLIHSGATKEDIAGAVYDAVVSRIISLALRIGIDKGVVLGGGVSNDVGFVNSLKKSLQTDVFIPEEPMYLSALGAALSSTDKEMENS